jgi:hypothetical protein
MQGKATWHAALAYAQVDVSISIQYTEPGHLTRPPASPQAVTSPSARLVNLTSNVHTPHLEWVAAMIQEFGQRPKNTAELRDVITMRFMTLYKANVIANVEDLRIIRRWMKDDLRWDHLATPSVEARGHQYYNLVQYKAKMLQPRKGRKSRDTATAAAQVQTGVAIGAPG